MRDLIACLTAVLRLLMPARGRHRASPHHSTRTTTTSPELDDFPHITASSWPRYYGDRPTVLDSHGLAAVRPYFVAYEERAERRRQRERRIAATLAPVGIDYDVALVA